MSQFLSFDFDPIDQPAATDAIERSTWCALRIRVGERFPSTVWDKALKCERRTLYLPAFPIIEWIVWNWWSILNERCPWESVPASPATDSAWRWLQRHNLRAANSAALLPALSLYHDGRSLRAEWQVDSQESLPNMTGEFITYGSEALDLGATGRSLSEFVAAVLARVSHIDHPRVHEVVERWRAIQSADADEESFCTLSGRMGIDPYSADEMPSELSEFFESLNGLASSLLISDLTEIAQPDSIVQQWNWLLNLEQEFSLGPNASSSAISVPARGPSPPQFGYRLAQLVREQSRVDLSAPLASLASVSQSVLGCPIRFEDCGEVPGRGIRGLVGRSNATGDVVFVGPKSSRGDNQRFSSARSLYHALATTNESQRLITNAFSWDQKASRAFAAELLAPRLALARSIGSTGAGLEDIERLSEEYQVSRRVIELQLENAGIAVAFS